MVNDAARLGFDADTGGDFMGRGRQGTRRCVGEHPRAIQSVRSGFADAQDSIVVAPARHLHGRRRRGFTVDR